MGRKRKPRSFEGVQIVDIARRGKCIGKSAEGEVLIVDDVVPGDVIDGTAFKKKKGLWQVKPTRFIKLSENRVDPLCEHFSDCGGCKWQNLDISSQLEFKEKQVFEAITRLGNIREFKRLPIVASPKTFEFRNKMEFSFSDRKWVSEKEMSKQSDSIAEGGLGLHPPGWYSKVVDIDTCHLIPDFINEIRNFIREESRDLNLTYYNHNTHSGDMRNVMMRINRENEVMVVFVFGSKPDDRHHSLIKSTTETFDRIVSVYYQVNTKLNDSTYDLEARLIYGDQYLNEHIGEVQFKIGPKSFFQTNIYQTEQLYAEVSRLADLTGQEIVYDLYSGIGSIALYIAKSAREIVAIEDVPEAIEDARINAGLNNIEHISYFTGKMEELIETDQLDHLPRPDVIITDPPRAGMHERVIRFILKQAPRRIVYVSCDPSTQARDINRLSENFDLISVQPFDMFPHTSHIESIALLHRK